MTGQLELFGAGADLERRVLAALQVLAAARYPGWRYTTPDILAITQEAPESDVLAALRALRERGEARRLPGKRDIWTLAKWPARGAREGKGR